MPLKAIGRLLVRERARQSLNSKGTVIMKTHAVLRDPSPIKISRDTLESMTDVFKLLSDPSRLKIVIALAQDGELHVNALRDLLGQSQSAVSHQLSLMRMAKLVSVNRKGQFSYYRLASEHICVLFDKFFSEAGNSAKKLQFDDFTLSFKGR